MKLVDGVLTLHQSDISHYMTCPEQFRQTNGILGAGVWEKPDGMRVESDAATVGTLLHAVIEHELSGDWFDTFQEAQSFGRQTFAATLLEYAANEVEYRAESFGDDLKAMQQLDMLVESWFKSGERRYWKQRDPKSFLIEKSFDVEFVNRPDRTISKVRLAGTADIVDLAQGGANRVLDWKSAGREYQRWEKQRWAPQPTVYTYAFYSLGLVEPFGAGRVQFDYRVFVRGKKLSVQELTVFRTAGQWGWMAQLVNNIADMVESDATVWPLRDDSALCGPKWCPVWDTCKGAFIEITGKEWL